ncbi:uncharacterized protein EI90DRAFT_3016448 [Cantharellus anzutake]|uniref:uncharacterized protein n=1 Tax=Cantharellus anzutake TaxID=1750568 RepID=UPI00190710AF|nr:uncharacterized protein EI90DRAFT_3016448 [Cantharellus anzutake]KAF8331479.1 hypothetical protein EI90DRAFT_3016448 [Cantharellus anzutake]
MTEEGARRFSQVGPEERGHENGKTPQERGTYLCLGDGWNSPFSAPHKCPIYWITVLNCATLSSKDGGQKEAGGRSGLAALEDNPSKEQGSILSKPHAIIEIQPLDAWEWGGERQSFRAQTKTLKAWRGQNVDKGMSTKVEISLSERWGIGHKGQIEISLIRSSKRIRHKSRDDWQQVNHGNDTIGEIRSRPYAAREKKNLPRTHEALTRNTRQMREADETECSFWDLPDWAAPFAGNSGLESCFTIPLMGWRSFLAYTALYLRVFLHLLVPLVGGDCPIMSTPTYGTKGAVFTACANITIPATPDLIFDIVLDFPSYPEWNTFVVKVDAAPGSPWVGESITLHTVGLLPFSSTSTEIITVLDRAAMTVAWRYDDGLNGIITAAEHVQLVRDIGGGMCEYLSWETYYRPLSLALDVLFEERLNAGFAVQAEDLRRRAISLVTP